MDVRLSGNLSGAVVPPPSKSQAHRLLICAALGANECSVACHAMNDDLAATTACLNALGADITYRDGVFRVVPIGRVTKGTLLDCGESGSTLRFLLSVAASLGAEATFTGHGKLPYRPNGALYDTLSGHGITFERHSTDAELPVTCRGTLQGGRFGLQGSLSSQYLTGLLFALPRVADDSEIEIVGGLASASYVEMTLDALRRSGIEIEKRGDIYNIRGGQRYMLPPTVTVETDWSAAAFWLVAGVVGGSPLTVRGANRASLQGDRRIVEHLRRMGAFIEFDGDDVVAMPSQLFGAELDCMDTPDLLPILSVAAAAADGETLFTNVGRLRYKESDRLAAMQKTLASFGIASRVGEDTFTVYGGKVVAATPVDSFGDHRIAMSAAVLSTIADGITEIKGVECVAKSYPAFLDDFVRLGGVIHDKR